MTASAAADDGQALPETTVLKTLVEPIRLFGILAGAIYLVDRAARRLRLPVRCSHQVLVAQPVAAGPRLPAGRGASIEVRALAEGDPALGLLDAPPAVAAFRFGQGAVCLGAFKGALPVGLIWLAFDRFDEDVFRLTVALEPKGLCAWDMGLYIAPEQRGGLAFARLWDAADAVMRERGVAWTLSRVAGSNAASNASHARLKAGRIGTLVIGRIGGIQVMAASCPPYLHIAPPGRPGPVLRLRAPDT